jgi:hypothetical protein
MQTMTMLFLVYHPYLLNSALVTEILQESPFLVMMGQDGSMQVVTRISKTVLEILVLALICSSLKQ